MAMSRELVDKVLAAVRESFSWGADPYLMLKVVFGTEWPMPQAVRSDKHGGNLEAQMVHAAMLELEKSGAFSRVIETDESIAWEPNLNWFDGREQAYEIGWMSDT